MSQWLEFFREYENNKLLIAVAGVVVGAILTKTVPALWLATRRLVVWLGRFAGGRFAYHSFQTRYLEWVISEYSELKLTGVVTSDDAKRPQLEQVFVSLQIGKERIGDTSSSARDFSKLFSSPPSWRELRELVLLQLERAAPNQQRTIRGLLAEIRRNHWSWRRQRLFRVFRQSHFASDLAEEDRVKRQSWVQKYVSDYPDVIGDFQLRLTMREHDQIAILGVPGAGKTTLLQYLALTHAKHRSVDRKLRDKRVLKKRLGSAKWRLPLIIRLSSIAHLLLSADNSGRDPSLVDVIPRILPPDLQRDDLATKFFTTKLRKGNCLVLLDGLDEVPTDAEFEAVVRAVKSLSSSYSSNQFVITSRIAGWRTGISENFEIFYVNDLTDNQTNTFIDTWYAAVERNAVVGRLKDESFSQRKAREQRAATRARDLKTTLSENIGIRRLASNPMLLSIIAVVHRSLATLPRERSKLYAQCSKILLEQWDISRGIRVDDTNLKFEQKESVMRRLAYALHTGEIGDRSGGREAPRSAVEEIIAQILPSLGRPAEDAEHLLQMLIERSGIITERQRGILAFAHHTFQEYFTAQFLAHGELSTHRDFLLRRENLMSDWWREVILLYSGLLSDSSDFIHRIRQNDVVPDLFMQRLRLAIMCLGEAVQVRKTSVRKQLIAQAAQVRNRQQIIETEQVFELEEMEYLVRWSRMQNWYSHAATAYAKTAEDKKAVASLISATLNDQEVARRASATFALAHVPPENIEPDMTQKFICLLNDEASEVRSSALENIAALREFLPRHEITIALLKLVERGNAQESSAVRSVFDSLGNQLIANPATLFKLAELLKSENTSVNRPASDLAPYFTDLASPSDLEEFLHQVTSIDVVNLIKITRKISALPESFNSDQLIGEIIMVLTDTAGESAKRFRLLRAINLSECKVCIDERVIEALFTVIKEGDDEIKAIAIETIVILIRKHSSETLINKLSELLESPNRADRIGALSVLTELHECPFSQKLTSHVNRLITSSSREERESAIKASAVVEDNSQQTAQDLTHLAQISKRFRAVAIEALGMLKGGTFDKEMRDVITRSLTDKDINVRLAALRTVSQRPSSFANQEVVEHLLGLLDKMLPLGRNGSNTISRLRLFKKPFNKRVILFEIFKAAALVGAKLQSKETFRILLEHTRTSSWLFDYNETPRARGAKLSTLSRIKPWEMVYMTTAEGLVFEGAFFFDGQIFPDDTFRQLFFHSLQDANTPSEHPLTVLGATLTREALSSEILRFFKDGSVTYSPSLLRILASLKSNLNGDGLQPYIKAAMNSSSPPTRLYALRLAEAFYSSNRLRSVLSALRQRLSDESMAIQDEAWNILSQSEETRNGG
jgi:HEAT repeat protein